MPVLSMLIMSTLAFAGAKKKANIATDQFRYDIEYAKQAGDGMCMVKVWSYSKNPKVATSQCRKNAVHGIIFKGYSSGDNASLSQKPLVKDPSVKQTKEAFFDAFFSEGGGYAQYVSEVIDGNTEVKKVGKEYKIGVVVTVSKDMLRKYLESEGVVRSLSSGF